MISDGRDDKTPECRLWRAVIVSCFKDAFERADATLENSDTEPNNNSRTTSEAIRGDARRWLCSNIEFYRSAREEVCDRANVDPNTIQLVAIAHRDSIKGRDVKRSKKEQKRMDKNFADRLESLVARAGEYSAKRLDFLLNKLAEAEDKRL
jgi:hypothetical protein